MELEALNDCFDLLVTKRGVEDSFPVVKNILLLDSEGKRVAVKYYSDDWPTNTAKLAFEKSLFAKTMKSNARTEDYVLGLIGFFMSALSSNLLRLGFWHVVLEMCPTEITMFDSNIVIYKFVQDLHFYVTGGEDENELILAAVLQGFFDSVSLLLRSNVDKREALENLDLIFLCLDEIVERGYATNTFCEPLFYVYFDLGTGTLDASIGSYSPVFMLSFNVSVLLLGNGPVTFSQPLRDSSMILETDANVIAGKVAVNSMDPTAPLSEQTIGQALATAREHLTRTLFQ
ncbi:hypothetical protein POTOM_013260 [Populus tomentosa]|uniref:Coatomer subunit zeta n=1 Tax=Populus tomentosa TaxID=118781 RepID=A0A8X8A015_POPTO|nr:hypothetical protein POTOM_013260 [Populus tomentosa]